MVAARYGDEGVQYLYYEVLQNLTHEWSGQLDGFPNDTVEVITKTAAVSLASHTIHPHKPSMKFAEN